jgi:hypothetical protein
MYRGRWKNRAKKRNKRRAMLEIEMNEWAKHRRVR